MDPVEGVDTAGMIVTGVGRDRVPPRYGPVLTAVVDAIADPQVSIHVYGSVASGRARPGSSDVDVLTIGLDRDRARGLGAALSRRFADLGRGVELAPAMPADLVGDGDEAYGMRVFVRHYCVHLAGPDPAADLPDHPADARAARGFNGDIGAAVDRWRVEASAPDADLAGLGIRIARKTLLAVAGLVSVHDHTWTTDRTVAATRGAELWPEHRGTLRRWRDRIDGTRPAADEVRADLAPDGDLDAVVARFADTIGLWPRPPVSG